MRTAIGAAAVLAAAALLTAAAAGASGSRVPRLPARTLPPPPLMDGIGTSRLPISTESELAQKYFDQGVNLLHCYWDFEAYRAFREVLRLDEDAAMGYWGLYMSLAYNQAEHSDERLQALYRAIALAPSASQRERRYVRAIERLNELGGAEGQRAFIDEMEALIAAYPKDLEAELFLIKFLITDAAGSFLDPDRGVGTGFDRARARLRPLLESHPDSLAVHHYWIHAHEHGSEPEAALVSARKIPTLAPKSGHILHMPGHIFYKVGDYEGAYRAFHASLDFDREYLREQGIEPVDDWNYVHNLDYLVINCAEDGRYREGRKWAEVLAGLPVHHGRGHAVGLGFVIYGGHTALARLHMRYGRWQAAAESLAASLESSSFPSQHGADYFRGLLAYTRGMAAVQRGDAAAAGQAFQEILGLSMAQREQHAELGSDWYFDVSRRVLAIASMELGGVLASSQGRHDQAIQFLQQAIAAEDQLGYGEPPHVTRPVRESLAVAYLRAGRWQDARRTFEQVLDERPNSGHAWYGIAKSHQLAGETAEARAAFEQFLEAWKNGDDDLDEIKDARAFLAARP